MPGDWTIKQASAVLINYPLDYQMSESQARNDLALVRYTSQYPQEHSLTVTSTQA